MDLPSCSRAAYCAQQGYPRKPGRWTRQTALVALGLYVRDEGRLPPQRYLHNRHALPSYNTVLDLFGSIKAYYEALPAAWRPVPRAEQAVPDPRYWHVPRTQVRCLCCDRLWPSPDQKACRICPACQRTLETDDGSWMTGEPVAVIWEDSVLWEENA